MRSRLLALAVLFVMTAAPLSAQTNYRIIGYFASWAIYARG